jgi:signal transduction histidine kinase
VRLIMDEMDAIKDGRSLHRRLAVPLSNDELARLALTLNGMLARLETSFGSLHRFTADASHELKTPLMVLRAGVERALTHPGTPAESIEALDESLEQVNQMSEMVEDLLTLARADEGQAPLTVDEADMRDLVADAAETAGLLAEAQGVEVTSAVPEVPVPLAIDRQRMRELLLNLVTNAVKYTPAGGSVRIELEDAGDEVRLKVSDTGIGIAPGDLPHIFDRFWRADPARSRSGDRPGVGLGLAITKWIAEAHGGTITVASRPGRGRRSRWRCPGGRQAKGRGTRDSRSDRHGFVMHLTAPVQPLGAIVDAGSGSRRMRDRSHPIVMILSCCGEPGLIDPRVVLMVSLSISLEVWTCSTT